MTYPYPFADRVAEDERLVAQAALFDPLTRRVLQEAGLAPGMRVLDLGSGSGNVARLAAEFVGPEGHVVGVERDPDAVALAQRHTAADNVEFRVGDAQSLEGVEDGFDAVIGRLVVLYLQDPVAAIRQAAARVRPGGLICLHEPDLEYPWAWPQPPVWSEVHGWTLEALEKAGIETRMGLGLHTAFRAAGLPAPRVVIETFAQGGEQAPAWVWANFVSAVVPLMEQLGVATRAEVDPSTLADRLLAETLACDGSVVFLPMFGAWTTVP